MTSDRLVLGELEFPGGAIITDSTGGEVAISSDVLMGSSDIYLDRVYSSTSNNHIDMEATSGHVNFYQGTTNHFRLDGSIGVFTKDIKSIQDNDYLIKTVGGSYATPKFVPDNNNTTSGLGGLNDTLTWISGGAIQVKSYPGKYEMGVDVDMGGYNITGADTIYSGGEEVLTSSDTNNISGRIDDLYEKYSVDTVVSASTISIDTVNLVITGTADIDSISTESLVEYFSLIYMEFTDTAGVSGLVDGKNIKLNGNFGYTPDDIVVLQRRGNYFVEVSRTGN